MATTRSIQRRDATSRVGLRWRRSPYVICYWHQGSLVYLNFATGSGLVTGPVAMQILAFFDRWKRLDELLGHLREWPRATLRRAGAQKTKSGLLERSDREASPQDRAFLGWGRWNPAAGFFHQSTKNVNYGVVDRSGRASDAAVGRPPLPFKRTTSPLAVRLPAEQRKGELPEVLLARRTWRRFSRESIAKEALGTLLGLTWRVQAWREDKRGHRSARRTSPSGGACHPLETYVLVLRVKGLERGLYHYSPERHTLHLIRRGSSARDVRRYLAEQWWFEEAAVVVLTTAVFHRKQHRYPYARAYRSILAEAGHFCQTFCLVATWLKLAPFCTMALRDSVIERDLGLDGVSESVIYAAGVGSRPLDIDSADPTTPGVIDVG